MPLNILNTAAESNNNESTLHHRRVAQSGGGDVRDDRMKSSTTTSFSSELSPKKLPNMESQPSQPSQSSWLNSTNKWRLSDKSEKSEKEVEKAKDNKDEKREKEKEKPEKNGNPIQESQRGDEKKQADAESDEKPEIINDDEKIHSLLDESIKELNEIKQTVLSMIKTSDSTKTIGLSLMLGGTILGGSLLALSSGLLAPILASSAAVTGLLSKFGIQSMLVEKQKNLLNNAKIVNIHKFKNILK